jgi:hypothetical protein
MTTTADTLETIKEIRKSPMSDSIAKTFNVATGLVGYDLEPAAKLLFPVLTPLRNKLPRVSANGGTATNFKVITAINTTQVQGGVSEGRRGGIVSTTVADRTAAYRGIGLEDDVTFEADYSSEGFDNAKSLAVNNLLRATMIVEERTILGGNGAVALGTTPTPAATNVVIAGATLAANTYNVGCVALTFDGFRRATLAAGVVQTTTRTNADGTTETVNGGSANKSALASVTVAAGEGIRASVSNANGAVGYAWYIGTSGAETLQAITTVNSLQFSTVVIGGRQNINTVTADRSVDSLVFSGLLYNAFAPGSGAQMLDLPIGTFGSGSTLTADGAGGVVEIDQILMSYWDNTRSSPTEMHMSARTFRVVSNRIVQNNNGTAVTPLLQIVQQAGGAQSHVGATMVTEYLNKVTNTNIKMIIHPDMMDGTILFYTAEVPYPLSNVPNICQMKMRKEYYQIEWPLRTRRYEYGVYADGTLQHYFPPSLGVMRNISVV